MSMSNVNNSRSSYNEPAFKPFQSGCSLCYPSKDYSQSNLQYGGNNQKLISNLPGKNLYKPVDYNVSNTKLVKDNYGISYNTSAGGSKSSSKKVSLLTKKIKSKEKIKISSSSKTKNSKKMKGGEESWGATGMPTQYYNPNANLVGYPVNSGDNAKTAYGAQEPLNVGIGMLAPNTVSKSLTANVATNMKTGGAKKNIQKKKNIKQSGKGLIPYISSEPISKVQSKSTNSVSKMQDFLKDLQKDYVKSVQKASSVKIGNQRLINGGKKQKTNKTNVNNKQKGGEGSDFISTLNSRGPSNAPDDYWGVPGEKMFRQFNKTANYIPNSELAKAATPKLLEGPKNNSVIGYNTFSTDFSPISGGKPTKKISKSVKKDSKSVKKDSKSVKKDSKSVKKDSKSVKKDSKSVKKDSKSVKKDSKPVKKDSKPIKKDSKPVKKDSKPAKKDSKPSKKDSKTTKKDSKPIKKDSKSSKK